MESTPVHTTVVSNNLLMHIYWQSFSLGWFEKEYSSSQGKDEEAIAISCSCRWYLCWSFIL